MPHNNNYMISFFNIARNLLYTKNSSLSTAVYRKIRQNQNHD